MSDTNTETNTNTIAEPEAPAVVTPPKRRGGAPRGNRNAAGRRRGRTRGSSAKTAARSPDEATVAGEGAAPKRAPPRGATAGEIAAVRDQLFGAHQYAALFTGLPELAITQEEAAFLAEPLAGTMKLVGLPTDLGKYMAPLALIMACGSVYGPRVASIKLRRMMAAGNPENAQAAPAAAAPYGGQGNGAVIVPMPGQAGAPGDVGAYD